MALLLFSVVMDLLGVIRKRPEFHLAGLWSVTLGSFGGLLAIGTGIFAARGLEYARIVWLRETLKQVVERGDYAFLEAVARGEARLTPPPFLEEALKNLESHSLLGLYAVGIFTALTLWRLSRRGQMRGLVLTTYLVGALLASSLLLPLGFLGGQIIHPHPELRPAWFADSPTPTILGPAKGGPGP
jgi:uncharacterized membrane protein